MINRVVNSPTDNCDSSNSGSKTDIKSATTDSSRHTSRHHTKTTSASSTRRMNYSLHRKCTNSILLLTLMLLSSFLQSIESAWGDYPPHIRFICPADCDRVMCVHKMRVLKRFCKHGTVYDPCGCCQVCAKAENEKCGGPMDSYGKCGPGLCCAVGNYYCSHWEPILKDEVGTCRRIPNRPEARNSIEMCKPRCTPEFCSKWPNAVCSAAKNGIIKRKCQAPCQHTVCQACYYKTQREPPCRKCSKDDFSCMKKFAKCVKRDTCTRHKYPCEPHQKKKSDGRFVCKIPACL